MKFIQLHENLTLLDQLFAQLDNAWKSLGNDTDLIPEFNKKIELFQEGKIKGIIGTEANKPICFAWIDLPNSYYGNGVVHTEKPGLEPVLIDALINSGYVDGTVIELVQFTEGFAYRDAFIERGHVEKERQRMIYELEKKEIELPELSPSMSFEALSLENMDAVAEVSYQAHYPRQNIEGYPDFNDYTQRLKMNEKIRKGIYGTVVEPASLMLYVGQEAAAICDVLALECWGYKEVAWYMDIAVKPNFQGMGISQKLLKKSLFEIKKAGYPAVGLSVTLSNKTAVKLYESIGFEETEMFVEIINKSTRPHRNPLLNAF